MSTSRAAIYLRAAAANDQRAIRSIIRREGLNPTGVKWINFVVAEELSDAASGRRRIVGIGQIKPYSDGGRELASIAVRPTHQNRGIAALIIRTLLAQEQGSVFLMCGGTMPAYYQRFGFAEVKAEELPRAMRRWFRFADAATRLLALQGTQHTLHAMQRKAW